MTRPCTCTPRYYIIYRESERLLAEAFDQESMRVVVSSGPIHEPHCPAPCGGCTGMECHPL